ncbi:MULTISPECIES: Mor transcription activator family protein [Aeromonas]|uniref:Mor transcription activator family protein n=1 Tax=Aeromonas TaxID=642 RepID=UPI002B49141C|nr:Mor transcription activator family protein [Aeromonas caviae]
MPKYPCSKFSRERKRNTKTIGSKYCSALTSNKIECSGYFNEISARVHVRKLVQWDRAIWDETNGRNIDQLARKHGLSVPQTYAVVAEQRQLTRRRIQPDWFQS